MEKLNLIISQIPDLMTPKNRVQSASSIKTLKQCPRKYFYKYIKEIDEGTNIYAVRGKAAHTALERFFAMTKDQLQLINSQPDMVSTSKAIIRNFFDQGWEEGKEELKDIGMPLSEIKQYHDETIQMLMDYVDYTFDQITGDFIEGFERLRPTKIEDEILSETMGVRGYIDVQKEEGDDLIVLDYKTSGRMDMNEHLFQLGLYALLIKDKYGKIPTKAGIIYLKFGGKTDMIDVTPELLTDTLASIEQAHYHTQSDDKMDYPRKPSFLCKWRTGQCGFYNHCMNDCT